MPKKIDLATWDRAEYFKHYFTENPCTYNLSTTLDVGNLHAFCKSNFLHGENLKIYPTLIYLLSLSANSFDAFKYGFENAHLVLNELIHPSYTIFHNDDKSFSSIFSDFSPNFELFYKNFLQDLELFGDKKGLLAKPNPPKNIFYISALPWINFTSFALNIKHSFENLAPIFTLGKICDNKTMPLSLSVHHAVCDGYHVGEFLQDLQNRFKEVSLSQ